MPFNLTLSEGVLPAGDEAKAVKQITGAFLARHKLTGNKAMTPNVTAMVQVLPQAATFSGGEPFKGAWVEWKTPAITFNSQEVIRGFFSDVTEIIHTLSGGIQPKNHIYVNVVHTVDGAWNFDGLALSNEEIATELAKG